MTKPAKQKGTEKVPLIIDTDMSPDSWTAILFAALNPHADLLAVSVSGTGETHGPKGAQNAQRLLGLAGKPDIPVGFGPPEPLKGSEHFPNLMRFVIDHMLWKKPPLPESAPPIHDSIELISELLRKYRRKVIFAAVGPQTNLATLLTRHPELKAKVKGIYIMGGALDVPGNIPGLNPRINNTIAEWNFFCDPQAAKIVIDSGVPVYLVPLDATNQIPITQDFKDQLASGAQTPVGRYVAWIINLLTKNLGQKDTFYLWDPITTACALEPSLAEFKKRKVDMVVEEGSEWGRVKDTADGSSIFIANKVHPEVFENAFISVLSNN